MTKTDPLFCAKHGESVHECACPTLTQALAMAGLSHRPSGPHPTRMHRHDVMDGHQTVLESVTAGQVWDWLREKGLHPDSGCWSCGGICEPYGEPWTCPACDTTYQPVA